jgi:capsular exopolysaccharide synthesis family protein
MPVSPSLHEQAPTPVRARNGSETVEGIAAFRLANRPKIELPKNGDNPLVIRGGRSSMAPATDAYKSLRTALTKLQNGRAISSVVVTSAVPSDGKTLTAFNLACCTAELQDTPVLLIDADLRTHALTDLIGKLPHVGLAEVLKGTASYEDAMVGTDIPNLYVMGAGDGDTASVELFSTDRWAHFMRWASESFKLVLVDSLPVGIVADFDLISAQCDGVLVVVRALYTPQAAVLKAIGQIDPKKVIGVVWNGDQHLSKNYYDHDVYTARAGKG